MSSQSKIWHPYTRFSALRDGLPVIVRGEGIYLFDEEGTRYVDGIASWWCCNLGHGHPRIVEAIREQAGVLQHSILGNLTHPNAMQLADRLAGLMATPDRHVLYASDGSSANEAAIKVAVQYFHNIGQAWRKQFIALSNPYHGDTIGAVSVGYMEDFHQPIRSLLFDCKILGAPARAAEVDFQLARLDRMIGSEGGRLVAGMIVEPLCQGASGMKMYPPEFLRGAYERCKAAGILFIVDEIAMGYGRTGTMWAHEQAGIDPDIVTVGKGLTGGYLPASATIVRDEIWETFSDEEEDRTFYHGHTFAGNPIATAAALAVLDVYEEQNIVAEAARKGALMAGMLEPLKDHPEVAEVRCLGMIGAVEFKQPEQARAVQARLREAGVLLRPLGATIYLMPPLIIGDAELQELCASLVAAA